MKLHYVLSFFLIVAGCRSSFTAWSQDVGFSQFYDQPLLRNPALAGIFTGDVRFISSFRNQWQSVTVPYRTVALGSELKLPLGDINDDNLTIGLQLINDVAGTSKFSTTNILPAVNYSRSFSSEKNSFLSGGFMAGFMQQRFDPTTLVLNDQFVAGSNGSFSILPSSRQTFNATSVNYFDLSAGLSYNGVMKGDIDYYIGVGMFHLTNPHVGFFEGNEIILNKKAAFNFGLSAPASESDQLIIYGDYFGQYTRKSFRRIGIGSLQCGVMYSHDLPDSDEEQRKAIAVGVLYRLDDAIIPVIKLEVSKFVVGVSYDANISKLAVASHYRGGFELTLSYTNFLNYRNASLRHTLCPRFGK